LAELREIIDRVDSGDSGAKNELKRELAKLLASLGIDDSE
jgi:hypothetical protein